MEPNGNKLSSMSWNNPKYCCHAGHEIDDEIDEIELSLRGFFIGKKYDDFTYPDKLL